ncbi:hypothetical protein [Microbulbifer sp.]|uniref:hypothetical protein n=1 Tax=Microbulbifer sp. TaxID=1908541 RepID=UPI002584DA4E|nr:hypothetical protein [Microbulbifer sp.]
MSNFTKEQKLAFLSLAEAYDKKVYEIVSKGDSTEILVTSKDEAEALENFSSKVCGLVVKDHPDIDGVDEDINADAEMVVHMVSDILNESEFGT